MDPLDGVSVFVTVARCGSFSAAAERLGCSKSTVSAQMTRLERRVGARLLRRSSRSVSLTEAGRAYLCQIDEILDRVQAAEKAARAEAEEPRGVLRLSAPAPFAATHIAPILPEFLALHPEVRVEMQVTAEAVDLVSDGFDLAIRLCPRNDPGTVVRKLGETRLILAAAPALLSGRRAPEAPADLAGWPALTSSIYSKRNVWTLRRGAEEAAVPLTPAILTNSPEVLHRMTLEGAGIGLLSEYAVVADLRAGHLVRLLPDWEIVDIPVLAVYPDNRLIAAKVKAFVDFLARRLQPAALMERPEGMAAAAG